MWSMRKPFHSVPQVPVGRGPVPKDLQNRLLDFGIVRIQRRISDSASVVAPKGRPKKGGAAHPEIVGNRRLGVLLGLHIPCVLGCHILRFHVQHHLDVAGVGCRDQIEPVLVGSQSRIDFEKVVREVVVINR